MYSVISVANLFNCETVLNRPSSVKQLKTIPIVFSLEGVEGSPIKGAFSLVDTIWLRLCSSDTFVVWCVGINLTGISQY